MGGNMTIISNNDTNQKRNGILNYIETTKLI